MSNPTTEIEEEASKAKHGEGPKYFVNIEGTEHPWPKSTITTEEIAALGGWDLAQGVIEIDKDNNEHTLQPGEVVELKPGHGFSKKVRWKRGENIHQARIEEELALLRSRFRDVEHVAAGQWVRVREYRVLHPGWTPGVTDVSFQIPMGYPGTQPYGIYVPTGMRYLGNLPANYQEPAGNQPPFEGSWGVFSWAPGDRQWRPTTNLVTGTNLLNFVLGFNDRFREGV
jgi:hypothetical protein